MATTPQNFKQIVFVRMAGTNQLVATPQTVVCAAPPPMKDVKPVVVATPPPPPTATSSEVKATTFTPPAVSKKAEPALKPPKPPDKPLLPYVRFSRTVYDQVKSEHPELKLWEIGKIIGQMWRDLPDEDKSEYVDKYKLEKIEYDKNYKAYLVSPPYLAYAAAKAKGETAQAQAGSTSTPTKADAKTTPAAAEAKAPPERKAYLESIEDDDDVDDACFKHMVACARYSRNYKLIQDIFSESVVPNEPPLVTEARIRAYRGHVAALTKYVSRLQNDIQEMEEKFEIKKRKIAQAAESFEREMKRLRK